MTSQLVQWRLKSPASRLSNRLFRCRSKKTSELCVTDRYVGNSPVTTEFPAQMASNTENVTILWRHHGHRTCVSPLRWTNFIFFNFITAVPWFCHQGKDVIQNDEHQTITLKNLLQSIMTSCGVAAANELFISKTQQRVPPPQKKKKKKKKKQNQS